MNLLSMVVFLSKIPKEYLTALLLASVNFGAGILVGNTMKNKKELSKPTGKKINDLSDIELMALAVQVGDEIHARVGNGDKTVYPFSEFLKKE